MRIISQKWSLNIHFWKKSEMDLVDLSRCYLHLLSSFETKVNRKWVFFLVFHIFDENWPSQSKTKHLWKFCCWVEGQTSSTKKLISLSNFSPMKFSAQKTNFALSVRSHQKNSTKKLFAHEFFSQKTAQRNYLRKAHSIPQKFWDWMRHPGLSARVPIRRMGPMTMSHTETSPGMTFRRSFQTKKYTTLTSRTSLFTRSGQVVTCNSNYLAFQLANKIKQKNSKTSTKHALQVKGAQLTRQPRQQPTILQLPNTLAGILSCFSHGQNCHMPNEFQTSQFLSSRDFYSTCTTPLRVLFKHNNNNQHFNTLVYWVW